MNRDIVIPIDSDYLLKLELLGKNNLPYEFAEDDILSLSFNDIKGTHEESLDIDLEDFENPLSVIIPNALLSEYSTNPIKYKLVLVKSEITLTLLSGNIYRS